MNLKGHQRKTVAKAWFVIILAAIECLALLRAAEFWPSPEEGAARFNAARSEIAITRTNIVHTLELLHDIKGSPNPQAQYQKFNEQFDRMQERADYTRKLAANMRTNGDAYFASWESQIQRLNTPEARQQAQASFADRKKTYDRISSFMQQAGKDFGTMLSSLTEIKKLIEGKPTPHQVNAAEDLFRRADWRCEDVQRSLMSVEKELQTLAEAYAAGSQPPPK